MWAVFSVVIIWLGALAATGYEDGMTLIEFMPILAESMDHPFTLRWTEHTPKFVFGALCIYAVAIMLYYSGLQNRRPGEEHGSAKWGNVYQLCSKYRDKDPTKNVILTQNLQMSLNARHHYRNLLQIVVGGSGAKKTIGVVLPNVMLCNASFIITDPKGSL